MGVKETGFVQKFGCNWVSVVTLQFAQDSFLDHLHQPSVRMLLSEVDMKQLVQQRTSS